MSGEAPIVLEDVSYTYGKGSLKKQILFNISASVQPGEIIILTGPSGSGKTTLLTMMGALRSAQEGSVRVLGQELKAAKRRTQMKVRRQIGFIFQSHNLLDSLTISQNVKMALQLTKVRGSEGKERAVRAKRQREGREKRGQCEGEGSGDKERSIRGAMGGR